jgi:LAO/AO transport system kinase
VTGAGDEAARLAERFRAGDRGALSRVISWAEREDPRFPALFDSLHGGIGRASRIGVTGPPGAGKSTLVSRLTGVFRGRGEAVGICAVDPTSPFTGGALLGDRIRMAEHALDPGVFIRSMATRGSLGGLARATVEVCDLLDAFGMERVVVETVGVGQSEFDVVEAADSVLVVLHPGAGDSVQAMKAGLLEIADLFVVNKADQPGVERLEHDLGEMLELRLARPAWDPPILRVSCRTGEGIDALVAALDRHRAFLAESGGLAERRARKHVAQIRRMVEERIRERLWGPGGLAPEGLAGTAPYAEAQRLLERVLGGPAESRA